ncbi:hypothetical protein AQUCO_03300065v1 [Aquilegia coerulea]|uniref:Uncharacterized protein n=1 Tax=Aquilegia coerulea TaxID=218851 RepID=A0A2G5CZA9_AQUCA|nr:hypothetical protein AQUCO_03300065v1 [Aquilegia coerulea]
MNLRQRGILLEGMRVLECRPPFRQMQKMAGIASHENMLSISSNPLVAMASQLSEAEKRERAFTGRGRCNKLRTMVDAKNLLQCIFSAAADARFYFCHDFLMCFYYCALLADFLMCI